MDCKQFGEYLDSYASLTDSEIAEMNVHASRCEECKAELDFMLSIIETTRSLPRITPPVDFIDRVNERINAEERKSNRASGRILRNLRTYRRQYAAAAACFALAAFVAVNGRMFMDSMDAGDGAVVESVSASPSAQPVPSVTPQEAVTPSAVTPPVQSVADKPAGKSAAAESKSEAGKPNAGNAGKSVSEAVKVSAKADTAQSAVGASDTSADMSSDGDGALAAPAQSASEQTVTENEASRSVNSVSSDTAAGYAAAPVRASESVRIAAAPEGRSGVDPVDAYSLENGGEASAFSSENEGIAVGKLRISTNEKKAMSVIERYSYSVDDGLYEVNVENFAGMLSSLNMENVEYSDYTILSGGVVRFQVDLVEN